MPDTSLPDTTSVLSIYAGASIRETRAINAIPELVSAVKYPFNKWGIIRIIQFASKAYPMFEFMSPNELISQYGQFE